MRAKRLKINKLYGYLDKDIELNERINLLVGINGSGKTSILNLVNWILTPSLAHLSVTEFKSIELLFNFQNKDYLSEVIQDDKSLHYNLKNISDNIEFHPLTVRLKIPTSRLTQNDSLKERYYKEYLRLNPDQEEIETWEFLYNNLPKPIVIGLDRYLFTEEKDEFVLYESDLSQRMIPKEHAETSPLDEVRKLANREYSIYKSKIVELNSSLNNKFLLSAFDVITQNTLDELESVSNITLQQVEGLHKKVEDFFMQSTSYDSTKEKDLKREQKKYLEKIELYFSNLKNVIRDFEKSINSKKFTLLYLSNISQFAKLKEFIKEFEDFDKKSQDFYADIKIYLDTINNFLKDSSKQLTFHKRISELTFNILDKNEKVVSRNRDIKTLSSGERQILILFTYLKFNSKSGTIFIIDEPELSLHPKWQEDFLKAVEILTPKITQIIIATHSPIIVGNNKNYYKVLLPYNN